MKLLMGIVAMIAAASGANLAVAEERDRASDAVTASLFLHAVAKRDMRSIADMTTADVKVIPTSDYQSTTPISAFVDYASQCRLATIEPTGRVVLAEWHCDGGEVRNASLHIKSGSIEKIFWGPPPPVPMVVSKEPGE